MATSAAASPVTLAESHQAGQEALAALTAGVLLSAWELLDLHDLTGTLPAFTAAVRAIIARYGSASGAAAVDYYRAARAAQVPGRASVRVAAGPTEAAVQDAVRGAVSPLYGPVATDTTTAARDAVDATVQRLVLNQGRDTIIDNVEADPAAKGWARVTEVGACSFCIMLALRAGAGLLYKTERSGAFQAHDHCACHVEPVFTAHEPSHRMRTMQQLWESSTKGRSGHDARVAFRQAVEGRPVTGV